MTTPDIEPAVAWDDDIDPDTQPDADHEQEDE